MLKIHFYLGDTGAKISAAFIILALLCTLKCILDGSSFRYVVDYIFKCK